MPTPHWTGSHPANFRQSARLVVRTKADPNLAGVLSEFGSDLARCQGSYEAWKGAVFAESIARPVR